MTSFAIKTIAACALAAGTLGAFSTAHAHITLEYQVAPANSSYKATFKVGHGCAGSPIRQIVVTLPPGVRGAKPMPKPGWQIEIERQPAAPGAAGEARRISWTARTREDMLPDAYYDEFVLQARLPGQSGALYWPVSQVCEQGRADWTEVPGPGQKLSDLQAPAAYLEILPAEGGGGHQH
ncbi:YcnI family protein [Variovorax terrae]|uniref:YcnI family protein n=1 Tax=Variovorax terrae TaxID=2923278 RepID=A0A9X2ANR6_9BURK|nr:YcnI family protein [Variovorax terrae]MCJ0764674.1 YcnI family protein [Variovorax terrae]